LTKKKAHGMIMTVAEECRKQTDVVFGTMRRTDCIRETLQRRLER
jgi:hypothetical protein